MYSKRFTPESSYRLNTGEGERERGWRGREGGEEEREGGRRGEGREDRERVRGGRIMAIRDTREMGMDNQTDRQPSQTKRERERVTNSNTNK